MNEHAGELAGLTQEEADEARRRLAPGARPAGEARALPAQRRHLRALPHAHRAARLAPVVARHGGAAQAGARRARRAARPLPPGVAAPLRRSLARGASRTGTSRASSGGVTSSRSGTARTGTPPAPGRRPSACAECGSGELERDPDVLDTWFSSALWPFATLGWPEDTEDLRRYYPGDVNSTAREIIRLWENRMIWTGLELVGDVPFHDVIIHSTVLAPDGRRMSKSLGTGIDPLELIDAHGADATRYGLLKMSLHAGRALLRGGGRRRAGKLANKLWNVARLLLANTERRRARRAAAVGRGALDPRAPRRRPRRGRGGLGAASTSPRGEGPLRPHLRRLLRLVRRGDQAAALRGRRGRRRDRARRARAPARAPAPGDAARDRGDLDAAARARERA